MISKSPITCQKCHHLMHSLVIKKLWDFFPRNVTIINLTICRLQVQRNEAAEGVLRRETRGEAAEDRAGEAERRAGERGQRLGFREDDDRAQPQNQAEGIGCGVQNGQCPSWAIRAPTRACYCGMVRKNASSGWSTPATRSSRTASL